ncbi:hypothetical protein BC826DRAFT_248475 [Russula brevipes]|nr:hypothetical protein BC826DRAFT_248475 [Russula brevipes]
MSSIQPVFHVHFPALLEQPPVDRVRKSPPRRRRCPSRDDPRIDHLGPDVRRAFGALAVLGVRAAPPPLWVRRCWRAAGGDRSRRRLVRRRPHFSPFYLDADLLLLRDGINIIRPRFGEVFGCIWRRNLSTLRERCVSGKSEPIKTVFSFQFRRGRPKCWVDVPYPCPFFF